MGASWPACHELRSGCPRVSAYDRHCPRLAITDGTLRRASQQRFGGDDLTPAGIPRSAAPVEIGGSSIRRPSRPARPRGRARAPPRGRAQARGRRQRRITARTRAMRLRDPGARPGSCASPASSASRRSSACAAQSSSIARIRSTCASTVRAWRAAVGPIETWSSWFALVGIESTDDGCASTLFSEASAAAVYWSSIRPRVQPGPRRGTRAAAVQARVEQERGPALADRAELGERELREVERERDRLAVEVAAADHPAAAGRERRPPATPPPSGKTSGLSVAEFSSMSSTRRRWSSASRTAPWTCGTQRSEYGSWTLCAWPWCARLEPRVAQEVAELGRDRDLARVRPGELVRRGERDSVPSSASTRHRRGHARRPRSRSASAASSAPSAAISCVPLSSASPSLASSVERLEARLAQRVRAPARPARRPRPGRARSAAAPGARAARGRRTRRRCPAPARPGGSRPPALEDPLDEQRPAAASGRARACSRAAGASPARPRAGTAAHAGGVAHSRFSWSRAASARG